MTKEYSEDRAAIARAKANVIKKYSNDKVSLKYYMKHIRSNERKLNAEEGKKVKPKVSKFYKAIRKKQTYRSFTRKAPSSRVVIPRQPELFDAIQRDKQRFFKEDF